MRAGRGSRGRARAGRIQVGAVCRQSPLISSHGKKRRGRRVACWRAGSRRRDRDHRRHDETSAFAGSLLGRLKIHGKNIRIHQAAPSTSAPPEAGPSTRVPVAAECGPFGLSRIGRGKTGASGRCTACALALCPPLPGTGLFSTSGPRRRGEMAEWLKASVSKTEILARVSRVRIPLSPPDHAQSAQKRDRHAG
jgi:hypothetical protein